MYRYIKHTIPAILFAIILVISLTLILITAGELLLDPYIHWLRGL